MSQSREKNPGKIQQQVTEAKHLNEGLCSYDQSVTVKDITLIDFFEAFQGLFEAAEGANNV